MAEQNNVGLAQATPTEPKVIAVTEPRRHRSALAPMAAFNEEKTKLKFYPQDDGSCLVVFWCPGCKETHTYKVGSYMGIGEWGWEKGKPVRMEGWKFNCDLENPTFSPSLKYDKCHLWLENGIIDFCWDCNHQFKGKKVPLEPF